MVECTHACKECRLHSDITFRCMLDDSCPKVKAWNKKFDELQKENKKLREAMEAQRREKEDRL